MIPLTGDYDIDRALVIDADRAPIDPVEPKTTVLDVLENRGFKNAKIKMPCVTADYASDSVHIDFVTYKKSGNQYYLAVGKKNSNEQNRSWSPADSKGLIDWVNDRSSYFELPYETQQQFQRLVRYLKRWRDYKFEETVTKKIFSIGLTVMVKQQFKSSFATEGTPYDLLALRDTVDAILYGGYFLQESNDQYRVSVRLPKEPWRDIFYGSSLNTGTQLWNKLTVLRSKLDQAVALDDVVKQAKILQSQFGHDFEVPDDAPKSNHSHKARYTAAGFVGTSHGA